MRKKWEFNCLVLDSYPTDTKPVFRSCEASVEPSGRRARRSEEANIFCEVTSCVDFGSSFRARLDTSALRLDARPATLLLQTGLRSLEVFVGTQNVSDQLVVATAALQETDIELKAVGVDASS